MDQLQEQNQTLQEQNQTLQTQVTTLANGRTEEELPETDTREFHPFSAEIAETPYPSDFREPPLKDYDGTTDPQAYVTAFKTQMLKREQGHVYQQHERTKRGYDHRGRNFPTKKEWVDHQRSEPVGNYRLAAITPLNTTRARILKEVYQSDLIRLPPQAEGPKGPDMSKWIERPIKEGYLGRYVEKRRDRGDRDRRRDEEGSRSKRRGDDRHKEGRGKEEVRGVVTTIAGGFTGGGETSSARMSLKVRRKNWPIPQTKEKDLAEDHKVFFAELDPREDFFERRPQSSTKEMRVVGEENKGWTAIMGR
ncbi:hypothetical protein SESBI_10374 [Sesbania bispinosa]|nr:hypothetical protein SESBI_10374 [Sesbania bispinosa]